MGAELSWADIKIVVVSGILTLVRVFVLIALATAIWVPIGVAVGLRPAGTHREDHGWRGSPRR
jgi:NitT/TauT family transport system permease protein